MTNAIFPEYDQDMLKYYKEIILVEAILLLQCWWWAPYIAFLLTSILVPVFSAVLLISILAEKIEKTRIEREYYLLVAGLAVLPVILLIAIWLAGGSPASYF